MGIRFGDCVFDGERRLVTRAGKPVSLSPKAFALLDTLIAERPRAVSKATLQDRLWPKTFVAQTSLARTMTELRQALGDQRTTARFFRTVHGFGYAFCGEAIDDVSTPGLNCPCSALVGEREVALATGANLIGRAPECVLRFNSPRVSRVHARILVGDMGATIEDLGSKNGTVVAGRRIAGVVPLRDGDEVVVGPIIFFFQAAPTGTSTQSASRKP